MPIKELPTSLIVKDHDEKAKEATNLFKLHKAKQKAAKRPPPLPPKTEKLPAEKVKK